MVTYCQMHNGSSGPQGKRTISPAIYGESFSSVKNVHFIPQLEWAAQGWWGQLLSLPVAGQPG